MYNYTHMIIQVFNIFFMRASGAEQLLPLIDSDTKLLFGRYSCSMSHRYTVGGDDSGRAAMRS